jgi:hypothetical protein
MECRDVRELAESFISEQLLTETNHELLRHLETCPSCRRDVEIRRSLRDAIRRAFVADGELQPTPGFAERLRDDLQHLQHTLVQTPVRRTSRWWALAAAATIVLSAAGGLWWRASIESLQAMARNAVGDHRNCALKFQLAEKPIALEDAARRYDPAFRVLETHPPDAFGTSLGLARVIERHSCVYQGRRFAHVVLQYRGRIVSLLVTGSDGAASIALPGGEPRHPQRVDAMSVVSVSAPGHVIFFVGDLPEGDVAGLAEAVGPSLAKALADI